MTPSLVVRGRGHAVLLAACVIGCSDGLEWQDALGPQLSGPAAPIVSDPVSFGGTASLNLTGTSFVYASLAPGSVAPGAASATIANARTGTSLMVAMVDGGFDPVAVPAGVGDTIEFAIQGGSPMSFALVVPTGLRPSVVRTQPPGRRDQPMLTIVRVIFSEPMDPVTITGGTVQILLNGNPLSGQVEASAEGLSATLELDQPLAPLTEYTLVIGAEVADLDGEALGEPITVTFTTGSSAEPRLSGALAFTDPDLNISVMNADGTNRVTLPPGTHPAWSPDGSRIAFSLTGLRVSLGGIRVLNLDGTNVVSLTFGSDADPAWSPDGSRIAFSRTFGESGIYLMNADGKNLVRLTAGRDTDPTWSPDGSRIAYTALETSPGLISEIYVMNADGTNRARLTNGDPFGSDPAWSPDGSRIAFSRDNGGMLNVFVMNADGTNLVRLTTLEGTRDPAWSRDGRMIAFTRDFCGHWDYGCDLPEVWVARPTDGVLSRLAPGEQPAWRP